MSDRHEPPGPPEYDPYESLTDLTGEEPIPALEDPALPPATPPRSPLLTGLILGLLLVVLSIAVFNLTQDDEAAEADATETTVTTSADSDDADQQPTTTSADDGTPAESTSTTTTEAPIEFDPYSAVGQPLALGDLTLQTAGIGEIRLGNDAADAVGKLVATLGEPTSDTGPITATGEYGACEGGTVRIVKFGALAAVVVIDDDGTETFAGYRLDLTYDEAATSVAVDLETLSGLKLGYSVTQLRDIYSAFDVEIVADSDYGRVFELRGTSGNLLLWGPVLDSGDEGTDTIMGIYSADASDNFC
ncbi:MAG: hypothetical protein QNJ75_08960 [Acidimicrobiia bacterium]|nr:hypothetical protein [Acidimicrobiia bacterium]